MKEAIHLKDLSFGYTLDKKILDKLSLTIEVGDYLLVVGRSGSGKSTFLRAINGLVPHFSGGFIDGSIRVFGRETLKTSTHELSKDVGFVFQDPEDQLVMGDVRSEIAFSLENKCVPPKEINPQVEVICEKLGIKSLIDRGIETLSGGEKQMVALASAIVTNPKILVLDEPTSQLDQRWAKRFLAHVKDLNEGGMTIVCAEHRVERILDDVSHVFEIENKRIFKCDQAPSLLSDPPSYIALGRRLKELKRIHNIPSTREGSRKAYHDIKLKQVKTSPRKSLNPAIEFENVSKSFGDINALKNISMKIFEGELVSIVGYNGSGKTTLVKHINGLLKPESGSVRIFGSDIKRRTVQKMAHIVGYIGQNPNDFLFSESVEEELRFTLDCLGKTADIEKTLEQTGLAGFGGMYPRDLSCGQRQLAAIASSLVARPRIIIFDEPTRGVDKNQKRRLLGLLKGLCSQGVTVIVITHDVDWVACKADKTIILEGGRITAQGTPDILSGYPDFEPAISYVLSGSVVDADLALEAIL